MADAQAASPSNTPPSATRNVAGESTPRPPPAPQPTRSPSSLLENRVVRPGMELPSLHDDLGFEPARSPSPAAVRRRVPGQLQRARALPATHSLGRAGGPRRERAADHRGGPYAWPRGRAAGARLQAPPELGVISSLSLSLSNAVAAASWRRHTRRNQTEISTILAAALLLRNKSIISS